MKLLRGLLIIAALLGAARCALASPMQTVPGARVNAAAESFVSSATGAAAADIRSIYRVPDRGLPAGAVVLKPHWPSGSYAPNPGFVGRLNVPVSVLVGGVIVDEVLVQVQVGPSPTATTTSFARGASSRGTLLCNGDPVHVRLQGNGVTIEMLGVVAQPGNAGDRIRVTVQGPHRVLFATIVSDREVAVEAEP